MFDENEDKIENEDNLADAGEEPLDSSELDSDETPVEEELSAFAPEQATETEGELFSLQSPEMAAKIQTMHENLTLKAQIEAAIFAANQPLKPEDLIELVSHNVGVSEIEHELQVLRQDYSARQGGFSLEYLKGAGFQFQTTPVASPIMAKMFASRPRPLSRAALETLSIIAYRQPCTRAAVEFIRGVDSGSIIKNLLERNLIRCTGRREDAGRPMLFGTTEEFLQVFGIGHLKDLPPLSAFQPSSDVMRDALKELDQIDAVEVEQFVDDETEAPVQFGAGLLDDLDESGEEHNLSENESKTTREDEISQDEGSQVALSVGDSIKAPSGEIPD